VRHTSLWQDAEAWSGTHPVVLGGTQKHWETWWYWAVPGVDPRELEGDTAKRLGGRGIHAVDGHASFPSGAFWGDIQRFGDAPNCSRFF